MAAAVIMPKAGITVESCIIGSWKKKVGDPVAVGDVLFDYETDKASFECESTAAGELLEIFYQEGDVVPCLTNVCAVGTKGEDCSALRPAGAESAAAPAAEAAAAPAAAAAAPAVACTAYDGAASPRARKLADCAGVSLADATGTGPNGRVIERDVRRLMAEGAPEKAAAAPAAQEAAAEPEYEDVKFGPVRKATVKSMMTSLHGMAQLTHTFSFDASELKSYRAAMKKMGGDYAGVTLGDMILFAVSRTVLKYPDLNANMLDDKSIRRFKTVHLGCAVDTPRGLFVPVIRNAERKSLLEISKAVKAYAAKAQDGKLTPDDMSGGTFTVSNLGSFDVESFTPIINPPQTGIIGVCTIRERPRTGANGQLELYPAMTLSLTYDHRAIDGAPASRFMQELCKNLEHFTALLAG